MASADLIELLANLDLVIDGSRQISLQAPDYPYYINEVLIKLADGLHNRCTVGQIKKQLWQEFQRGYEWPDYAFDALFQHGSCELQHLSPEMMTLVEERKNEIRLERAQDAPRSRRSRLIIAAPGNDRPSAMMPPTAKSKSKRERNDNKSKRSSKKKRSHFGACLQFSCKLDSANIVLQAEPRRQSVSECSQPGPEVSLSDTEARVEEIPHHPSPSSSAKLKHIKDSTIRPVPVMQATTRTGANDDPKKSLLTRNVCVPNIPTEHIYSDMLAELAYYKQRCGKAEQRCEDLKKERRQMESLKAVPADIAKASQQINRENIKLRRKLQDRTDLERYLPIGQVQSETWKSQELLSYFQLLKTQILKILVVNGQEDAPLNHMYGEQTDLADLLSTLFDKDVQNTPEELLDQFPPVKLYEVVQALTGASIHLWVFGAVFRPHAVMDTPILQKYRNYISTLCGDEVLFDLDVAAHRSIFAEESFKDVMLPRLSEQFTDRLYDALEPLFGDSTDLNATKALKSSLRPIFNSAIRIRTESLLSSETFASIWPSNGSLFDPNEMEMNRKGNINMTHMVRLPICPGLRAIPKRDSMINHGGLIADEHRGTTAKYVIKAMVL